MSGPPTFAVPPRFLGYPERHAQARVTIAGIPHDIGTTNRAGARFGHGAIRHASRMLVDGAHPVHWVDVPALPVQDIGDFAVALGDIPATLAAIESQAAAIPHLVALGGEHGISLPLLRALRRRLGRPLALLHFDAHLDTWRESFGQAFGHGSPFFHAANEGLIDPHTSVQVGIRSPVDRATWDWTVAAGFTIIPAWAVHERGPGAIAAEILARAGEHPAYLTFDIDALDPAAAPGTGTPEPGGLSSWQAQAILRRLTLNFAGMDMVEVAPAYDHAEITALAAATMVWEYLARLEAPR